MSDSSSSCVRVAFKTLGCKVNRVESDEIAAELLGRGVEVADEDAAAVIIITTCTVTAEADAKARKAVRQALKAASKPVVVVTGCLAALDAPGLTALGDRVVVEADKQRVAELVASKLSLKASADRDVLRVGDGFRTRAMLKIEDGCDNFCSYCIVPYARGVPRSVAFPDVVAQARALVAGGAHEIVLTGINIGRYADAEWDLAAVVRAVAAAGAHRVRLSSIEPPDLTDRLLEALAETDAVCEHLHVPLQSGSDAVLRAMRRTYTAEEFRVRIDAAKGAIRGLAVTTDVIAGFPGESADDHRMTLEFVESIGFAKLHVFRYSVRPGTPAAGMQQVDPAVRSDRAAELRARGDALRVLYVDSRVGEKAQVLVESADARGVVGTTRDYLRVRARDARVSVGSTMDVVLTTDSVIG